ncbi:GH36-type glycosyl hydrolase domain-containing protein [Pseudocolwellia sp. HL-MZ7]|uniref:GH36-type glycosyl hydrolase domain-containing protein n=1 Tax=Pseudocolwellia sp. HL-MZ7 TaxID=3400627 RepID=UPI003CF298DA
MLNFSNIISSLFCSKLSKPPWNNIQPVREELFGVERLEQHAISLAKAQKVSRATSKVVSLQVRLKQNATVLLAAYHENAKSLEAGNNVVPAAEWLLDNYHLIEQQIREVRDDLPDSFYRQLPKLASGPFAGYPRVFGLAWAYVAHTDSHFDEQSLCKFIKAYQSINILTIGELWAVAITLRIVLIENLRRLVDQISVGRVDRDDADQLADRLMVSGSAHTVLLVDFQTRSSGPLSEIFAAQLAKRLRDQDPNTTPALEWLEQRLEEQGLQVDSVVQHSQQREGASNVTVRNIITSMRLITDIDWTVMFEKVSLVDETLRNESTFDEMDAVTRNSYRNAIEQLSRGSTYSEIEIARLAVKAGQDAKIDIENKLEAQRIGDPGYYLIDKGRSQFEQSLKFKPNLKLRLSRVHIKIGLVGYVSSIILLALVLVLGSIFLFGFNQLPIDLLVLLTVIGFLPATEISTAIINRSVTWRLKSGSLPGLEFKTGVPTSFRTLIAVPTLLTNINDLSQQVDHLEVHYLGGIDGDLTFALLVDGLDAEQEILESDHEILSLLTTKIDRLNQIYPAGPAGKRFLLLYRKRQFNPSENKWMGWERKRGKLHELNRLLRGATDTSFIAVAGNTLEVPTNVRYVITLDADTRLPRETTLRLISRMAHPLNRPRFNTETQRIEAGYGIIQPRVTPSLPIGVEGSFYQRVISSPGGMDPYAAANSDVYQDLFGEGSFTGKGIYDIDAFESALAGRVKENVMLSHDLFEGIFARAALISDVEVVEEFPARYDVLEKRQHRWTRGDWQLLPWIFSKFSGSDAVSWIGRWKLLDNLRRSVIAPMTFMALVLCWLLPFPLSVISTVLLLSTIIIPVFTPCVFSLIPPRPSVEFRHHIFMWFSDLRLATAQVFFKLAFLPDQSYRAIDAICRTLIRLFVTRRHLLEWTSSAQSNGGPHLTILGFYKTMWQGTLLSWLICITILINAPSIWSLVIPFLLLWIAAPLFAFYSSRPIANTSLGNVEKYADELRLTARRTWRYFETFVTDEDNMLPPDNFQQAPEPIIAHRTSPTNIGLYLLSAVAARDFGWIGLQAVVNRLEITFITLNKLPRYKGHFYNWYATQTLETLNPAYVSSVDSGNFAGHLITLANVLDEWQQVPISHNFVMGMFDNLNLLNEAINNNTMIDPNNAQSLNTIVAEISMLINEELSIEDITPSIHMLTKQGLETTIWDIPTDVQAYDDIKFWLQAISSLASQELQDHQLKIDSPQVNFNLIHQLKRLAKTAREMANGMNFAFLINPERKLMSIGYSQPENSLDSNCYDLLASEARLASLFAIAKGDVSTKHWFHLGRTATPLGKGSALISWSGSMFEYLMPSLIMRAPVGSLLEQTNRLVVERQKNYGSQLGIPWGISESGFNARDIEFTYQYSNFGVPGLGLKRGLSENRVIAPYATGLASMIDPGAAVENYQRLKSMGACGRYGFFEALDFTPSRVQLGTDVAIVESFMAHHQGMTIVAIVNCLRNGLMRSRFHREPCIQACELLLQERMPRDVAIGHPRAEEVKESASVNASEANTVRHIKVATNAEPITHLLSNGCYTVMLTATGSGYSRWGDFAVTRWQSDPTCDNSGSYILLRDVESGNHWSSTAQPFGYHGDFTPCIFAEDHARFMKTEGNLTTTMDVLVSGEDDGEVRKISISNKGHFSHEIEFTSFAELVLALSANDNAHPAFSKMFAQTQFNEEYQAIIATRRKRSADDADIWAGHFAIIEGEITADVQYETSRANFIGRGNTLVSADAMTMNPSSSSKPLTNTVGCVLDPIFSLRYRIKVPPQGTVNIAFWTVVASSKEKLLEMIDRHNEPSAYDRAKTLAWTQAQVQLRHLGIEYKEVADFQRLAAPILYEDPRFKAPSVDIIKGIRCQSELWSHSISGDLPIVLMLIDDIEDIAQVKQLLRAHEYWRMKCLAVDIVIINEHPSGYMQDLHNAIETAVRSSQSRPAFNKEFLADLTISAVHVFRADMINSATRDMLRAIAHVVLVARHGLINKQFMLRTAKKSKKGANTGNKQNTGLNNSSTMADNNAVLAKASLPKLEFYNGLGGFANNGREYVIHLHNGECTPAPWINVIANQNFGFHVSAEGSGYTWSENSRENQLTTWSNDAVSDPIGEIAYVCDQDNGEIYTATAQPAQDKGSYLIHHGYGYSRFDHKVSGLSLSLSQYVPVKDSIKISRLTIHNESGRKRRLSVTAYAEWVLGTSRNSTSSFITSSLDPKSKTLLLHNHWGIAFPERVAFFDMAGEQTSWTTNRTEFIGRNGNKATPSALSGDIALSGTIGAGYDTCTALQTHIELADGESREIIMFIGQGDSEKHALELVDNYRRRDLNVIYNDVQSHWEHLLNKVQVKTPDRAMDIMLNGWLLYQTIACRIWARSSFYQASGAYGFRDQLQDGMSLTFSHPTITREHLLRAAARQFIEGDVQHWWLPHSGQGVRSHISDDRVWLALATAKYIKVADDKEVLKELIPFLEGKPLGKDQHDAYFKPNVTEESASLFEHCARGLDECIKLTGEHGFPLMGTGDWNDGMNLVGAEGKGESVWLGWLLIKAIDTFAVYAFEQDNEVDRLRGKHWQEHADKVRACIDEKAWDGQWYRRATFDDGTWLGSKSNEECQIDSIAQSWSVLANGKDQNKVTQAMLSAEKHLIKAEDGLALLFTPAFDKTAHNPGYIKGYPPGLRENGGQYTHAAMWFLLALTQQGKGKKSVDLFSMLNPINHASNREKAECYKVEPYVVAADIYSIAPYIGRGGWTWYTGAAGWMYQAGLEGILGIRREGNNLIMKPCIPDDWPEFSATLTIENSHLEIKVNNLVPLANNLLEADLDGISLNNNEAFVSVELKEGSHCLTISAKDKSIKTVH